LKVLLIVSVCLG